VIGEGPKPREIGKTICAYTLEHAYINAEKLYKKQQEKKKKGKK
jgi:hypothetical protein